MIEKLRRKFIWVNMGLVTAVLLVVFGAICLTNYQQLREETNRALERMLMAPMGMVMDKPQIGLPQRAPGLNIPAFSVLLGGGESPQIERTWTAGVTVTADVLDRAVAQALASPQDRGVLGELNLRYLKRQTPEGLKIAFADRGSEVGGLWRLALISLGVGACSLAAFFCISLFLANWALRPVKRAWQQQRQFVADASHELKTPLTVILANTGVLQAHPEDRVGEQMQWVSNTREEALRMKGLVEDMLFLAKSDAGAKPSVCERVNLSDLVTGCLLSFEPVAFEAGVALEAEVEEAISVQGDGAQLKQLTAILLDNAVKYAGEGGAARISLGRVSAGARLVVCNSGDPIPAEDLPRLFDRFYRVDKARGRDKGGYGLGLAIAKGIVEAHGGRIGVKSGPAQGACFTVTLPSTR